MGLGKTVQVIALLLHLRSSLPPPPAPPHPPFLVIVPASVLPSWQRELARFAPSLGVATYAGGRAARDAVYSASIATRAAPVVLTTFEYAMQPADRARLARVRWSMLVVVRARGGGCGRRERRPRGVKEDDARVWVPLPDAAPLLAPVHSSRTRRTASRTGRAS